MNFFTKAIVIGGFLSLLALPFSNAQAEEKARPRIIAASATSSAEGSAPVTCLLDPACQGYWQPQSADAGSNEGIYIRFQEPTLFNFIEITTEEALPEDLYFAIYLDAQTTFELIKNDEERLLKQILVYKSPENTEKFKYIASAFTTVQNRETGIREDEEAKFWQAIDYRGQSVFIALGAKQGRPPKIRSIRFSQQAEYYAPDADMSEPQITPLEYMPLELPRLVPATAVASSTLEPAFAYNTAKLFDSQTDMAWSTDGKKSDGRGETIHFTFESEEKIHGLMLWNGYQRSTTHFLANARVKTLRLGQQSVKVQDIQGPQSVKLKTPIKGRELLLEIADIYPGGSYKDVLISELRFLGPANELLLPILPPVAPAPPPALAEFLDRSLNPILGDSMPAGPPEDIWWNQCTDNCVKYDSSLRLRSNGSFVIYNSTWGASYSVLGDTEKNTITEGNWEALADGSLRLFGKKYQAAMGVNFSSYLKDESKNEEDSLPPPRIFQSLMAIKRFSALSRAEQENVVRFMLQSKSYIFGTGAAETLPPEQPWIISLTLNPNEYIPLGGGSDLNASVENIMDKLNELDPIYIKSDVYSELLL